MSTNSTKSFKFGLIGIGLMVVMVVLIQLFSPLNSDVASILIGLLTFSIGIIGIVGLVYSLKGIREPNTLKKILGLIISFGTVLLFLFVILSNVYDMYKAFN